MDKDAGGMPPDFTIIQGFEKFIFPFEFRDFHIGGTYLGYSMSITAGPLPEIILPGKFKWKLTVLEG
jgi:hypothetical protein